MQCVRKPRSRPTHISKSANGSRRSFGALFSTKTLMACTYTVDLCACVYARNIYVCHFVYLYVSYIMSRM